MIGAQNGKYTKALNIARKSGVEGAELEIVLGIEVAAKEKCEYGGVTFGASSE
jgi:hypothetical protein